MKRQHGFTLVELLVVIGIIALLISILLPTLGRVRAQAQVTACSARMHDVMLAVIMYANDNKDMLPPVFGDTGKADFTLTGYDSQFNSMFQVSNTNKLTGAFPNGVWPKTDDGALLGRLYRTGHLKTPKVFICPSANGGQETTGKVGRDFRYYAFNIHTKMVGASGAYVRKFWWNRLSGYGKVNAGRYMVGGGGTNSEADVSIRPWRHAMLIDTLWVDKDADNQGHKLGLSRSFNLAYADGSVSTYRADKWTSRTNVSDWAGFTDLANAIMDAKDGGDVNWRAGDWTNKNYNAIPINPR